MKNLLIILIFFLLVQCEPVVPQKNIQEKRIVFDNHEYEPAVGMVQLQRFVNGKINPLENPVINIDERDRLLLNFDLLSDQFENLSAKVIHCDRNWNRSQLRDMEFLSEINNYRITEFDYSQNTTQNYINYQFTLPQPSISGNYIIAVFRRANPNDLLLTRKFMVYEPIASIDHLVRISNQIDKREENQQIEFTVAYGNLFVTNPMVDVRPTILQNHNWATAINEISPTLVRPNEGSIEYRNIDLTTNFPGWNEFRWTDLRTLDVTGRNVSRIQNQGDEINVQIGMDKSRATNGYSLNFRDINGNYLLQNNDQLETQLNSDYAKVRFFLKHERINGNVYVTGRFNNWRLEDENQMQYDPVQQFYFTDIKLKQGYYDYQYIVQNSELPPFYFEGSHFQTENEYEILVYYRRPGNINDQLIGYKNFRSIEDL